MYHGPSDPRPFTKGWDARNNQGTCGIGSCHGFEMQRCSLGYCPKCCGKWHSHYPAHYRPWNDKTVVQPVVYGKKGDAIAVPTMADAVAEPEVPKAPEMGDMKECAAVDWPQEVRYPKWGKDNDELAKHPLLTGE